MSAPQLLSIFWANDFPPITSGIATYLVNLVRRLPADRVIVMAPVVPGSQDIDATLAFKVRRRHLPTGESRKDKLLKTTLTVIYAVLATVFRRRVRHHCGQVVSSGLAGLICKKLFRASYLVYVYGSETVRLGKNPLANLLMRSILKNSERVIAISQYTADEFVRFGVDPEQITIVYPGVDTGVFKPIGPDTTLISRYDLSGKRILLTVARLDERKGHDLVIRALAALSTEFPDLVYLIAGKGRESNRLRELAEESGVENRVLFLGFVPEEALPSVYNLCDVFVMPNRVTTASALVGDVEGFGISFMEASACGKPVIAGRSGGAVEAVVDGETGMLIDPNSPEDLTEAIRRLIIDPDLRRRLGDAGRRRAEASYDWCLLARQIEAWV